MAATGQPLGLDGWRGEWTAAPELAPADPAAAVVRLADPGAAAETLHWGRNYLYRTSYETAGGERVAVVVKQFPAAEGRLARLDRRLRGTKAERNWRTALAFEAAGIPTPAPVCWFEPAGAEGAGAACYVCRFVEGATELRYLLRAAARGRAAEELPHLPLDPVLERLGSLVRRLHEHRIWFRDMTSGNVLLVPADGERGAEEVSLTLVDLNRARRGRRLTPSERTRDLSRMPIHRRRDQERFLAAYWRGDPEAAPPGWARLLYRLHHHGFLARNRTKKRLRAARDRLVALVKGRLVARSTHAHIPEAPREAPVAERVVWDHLSDQPHLHASPLEKLGVRLGQGRTHLETAAALGRSLPAAWRRHRRLGAELYRRPVPFAGAGVAVRPWPREPAAPVELVRELGARHVLVRLHPWAPEERDAEEELVRALAGEGVEVSFALPQNRDLVVDPARWRAAVAEIAERFTPFGRAFQVGQAVNRSKWGVWTPDEYARLVADARAALAERRPDVEILGPAVIDFEYHATAALLNLRRPGLAFDAVSALLYVDRRGAPENRQAGFDTVGKVTLLKAIAETAANAASGRCWVTEVNWPLREGPHSPAGKSVSVGEEEAADYLVRYLVLALGTGCLERVFWWQAIARGYGLVCPEEGGASLRRRPTFAAFRTLLAELADAESVGPLGPAGGGAIVSAAAAAAETARLHLFRRPDGAETVVGWSAGEGPVEATLPRPAVVVTGRDGEALPPPGGLRVTLLPSPRYFRLG